MPAQQKRRWFQFSLPTLLILITLIVLFGIVAAWWIALPTQTWDQFAARCIARDIDGANELCQPPVRVVYGNAPLQPGEINPNTVKYLFPNNRTFSDMLFGRVHCARNDRPNRSIVIIEVQGNRIIDTSTTFYGK
ncbi:MAG: hypothetical protein K8T25_21870 [Planctomycetia bacterium]|nr:hypothetical protein [Planctomycetia bacterium]